MLADPKSEALTNNFAGQWLFLRDLAHVQTSATNFDDNLRQSFRTETEMLFANVVHEDDSLLDTAERELHLRGRAAGETLRHSRIFTAATSAASNLPADSPRRGLLGQGSILTVTSVATRTSPVTRGRWILENLLGTPAPIPPPGVDTNLEKNPEEVKNTSLRAPARGASDEPDVRVVPQDHGPDRLRPRELRPRRHVARRRRTRSPVDASGQLVDGTIAEGPADLRAGAAVAIRRVRRPTRPKNSSRMRSAARCNTSTCRRCGRWCTGLRRTTIDSRR